MSRPSFIDMDIPHEQTPGSSYRQHIFTRKDAQYQMPAYSSTQDDNYNNLVSSIGQAVKFLISSILFGGTEEKNVTLWLERIETIARRYNLSPTVKLSAAIAK